MKKKAKQKSAFPDDEDQEDSMTAAINRYKKYVQNAGLQKQVQFWETAPELLSKIGDLNMSGLTYTSASPNPTASSYVASTVSLNK